MEAIARVDLGISSDEFWRLTRRQFFALMERRAYRDMEFVCHYANLKGGKDSTPITPDQLLRRPAKSGAEVFRAFERAFNGETD